MPGALHEEPLRLRQEGRQEGRQRGLQEGLLLRYEGRGRKGVRGLQGRLGREVQRPAEHVRQDGRQHLLVLFLPEGDTQGPLHQQRHRGLQRQAQEGDQEEDPDELRGQRHGGHHGDLQKLQQLKARQEDERPERAGHGDEEGTWIQLLRRDGTRLFLSCMTGREIGHTALPTNVYLLNLHILLTNIYPIYKTNIEYIFDI